MAVEEGEILFFEVEARYKTRAQVLYMAPATNVVEPYLRLGVRFLDDPMPEGLIPAGAEPLE